MSRLSLLVSILLAAISPLQAQWVPCSGPRGGPAHAILIDGPNIYAGSSHGVHLSTNQGVTWTSRWSGIPATWVNSLVKVNDEIYAATSDGVFKTSNGGETWEDVSFVSHRIMQSLLYDNDILYCGSREGVYITQDYGENWSARNTGLADNEVVDLVKAGGWIFAACRDSGIFRSSDAGMNWEATSTEISTRQLRALYGHGDTIYTATSGPTYFSTDFGDTWDDINSTNDSISYALSLFRCGETFFVSSYKGLFASTDNGATWSLRINGLDKWRVSSFACDENFLYAGTNYGGVYRSTDMGLNWTEGSTGYTACRTDLLLNLGNRTYADAWSGIQYTSDNGETWLHPSGVADTLRPGIIFASESAMWASTRYDFYQSTDSGAIWKHVFSPSFANFEFYDFTAIGSMLFGIDGTAKLRRSVDDGASWIQIATEYPDVKFRCLYSDSTTLIAGTDGQGIFVSHDLGKSWNVGDTGTPTRYYHDFARRGMTYIAVGRNYLGGSVLRSSDLGVSWELVDGPDFSGDDFRCALAIHEGFIVGGTDGQLYLSTDDGLTWMDIFENLPENLVLATIQSGDYILVSFQDEGVWRRPLEEILQSTGIEERHTVTAFLSQLYPNPVVAGQTAVVSFSLEGTTSITLRIQDILGRTVQEQSLGQLRPGIHSRNLNTVGLQPGIYFYSLRTENRIAVSGKIVIR